MIDNNTICALATAPGNGAIAVIRVSGSDAFSVTEKIFFPVDKKKKLSEQEGNTIHFGTIKDKNTIIDEVLVSVFKAPYSYTGEHSVEISCHGSLFIQKKILELLVKNGARQAGPGEYTQRAYLNGKLDLSQAEAVADLIASESAAAHKVAVQQLRGGFSTELSELREQLLNFISLIELELDFDEEDVEFADRQHLSQLIQSVYKHIKRLADSFELGNAVKHGIPVAIVGEPNVGKSTLLNAVLKEDKAIVSEIAGTTRDAVEDVISIEGILYRFIDTAGIRQTNDTIEKLGIKRTMEKMKRADLVLLLLDASNPRPEERIAEIKSLITDQKLIIVFNKIDNTEVFTFPAANVLEGIPHMTVSAKYKKNITELTQLLSNTVNLSKEQLEGTVVTNVRHLEALNKAKEACERVEQGLQMNIPGDLLSQDIHDIMDSIGSITGTFSADEVLGNIFKNFCIGK
ncbi:MAG: tRNA uridine-5-carboxymethylaminomethyl(34) synthesis GTPase MnmE [Bacteroidota bacterium]|nr:tRNA uridine-5-carboxymethylaminomethyl(34) synthesis GTPase MnmE [Bacteroidota bacterium]